MQCSVQPWVDNGSPCGTTELVPGRRVTCEELGLTTGINMTFDEFEVDAATGHKRADFAFDGGFHGQVYTNSVAPPSHATYWGLNSHVKADGSVMGADAMILSGTTAEGSLVVRFDQQFWVRDIGERFVTRDIQVCGFRLGHAASLPPPEPGTFSVTCGFPAGGAGVAGSLTAPGPMITSQSSINYEIKVTPPPPEGTVLQMRATLFSTGEIGLGVSSHTLSSDTFVGGFSNAGIEGQRGSLALQFAVIGQEAGCTLHWNLQPEGGGGGGKTW